LLRGGHARRARSIADPRRPLRRAQYVFLSKIKLI
jgi:hypothetical protein